MIPHIYNSFSVERYIYLTQLKIRIL